MPDRGVYRGVYCSLPDGLDFQRLSPMARLTLYTARLCRDCGPASIFRFYPELLAKQTGLRARQVTTCLDELQGEGWVDVEGPVLWIVNGLRYDPYMRLSNRKHKANVLKAISALPRLNIVLTFCDYYSLPYPFDRVSGFGLPSTKKTEILHEEDRTPNTEGIPAKAPTGAARVTEPDGFDRFWSLLPSARKVNKPDARKAWAAVSPDAAQTEKILTALKDQLAQPHLLQEDFRYFPHPHRWLAKRRWEDEAPSSNGHEDNRGQSRRGVNAAWAGRTETGDVKL